MEGLGAVAAGIFGILAMLCLASLMAALAPYIAGFIVIVCLTWYVFGGARAPVPGKAVETDEKGKDI